MELIRGRGHAMAGYLVLPASTPPAGDMDVLVVVDGAGSQFRAAAARFAAARGDRPTLVLAPCSVSNTYLLDAVRYPFYSKRTLARAGHDRILWDVTGVAALLSFVRDSQGGRGAVGITGFSGGGSLCYALAAMRPDLVDYAVPACANFLYMGFARTPALASGGPKIRILTGSRDPHRRRAGGRRRGAPGIERQTAQAITLLRHLGVRDIERRRLSGVGHESCADEVWRIRDRLFR